MRPVASVHAAYQAQRHQSYLCMLPSRHARHFMPAMLQDQVILSLRGASGGRKIVQIVMSI